MTRISERQRGESEIRMEKNTQRGVGRFIVTKSRSMKLATVAIRAEQLAHILSVGDALAKTRGQWVLKDRGETELLVQVAMSCE